MAYEKYGIVLTIGSDKYQVESISLQFQRGTGSDGRPNSIVTGSQINLSGAVTPTDSSSLVDLMINSQNAEGKLEMTTADEEGVYRTITFKNAYIVNYSEQFSAGSDYQCTYVISAESITVGKATLDNKWPIKS
jgi:hypothetical protein